MSRPARGSFQNRLIVTATATAGIAVLAMTLAGTFVSHRLEKRSLDREITVLTNAIAARKEQGISRLISDTVILANMPSIKGIERAATNGGHDPLTGDATRDWLDRLAEEFAAFHVMRPDVAKLSLLTTGGQELLGVDRAGERIVRVPDDQLLDMGRERLVVRGQALPPGEPAIIEPSYDRENGVISEPRTVMLRIVLPVFGDTGDRFGMVVMNVDLERHNALVFGSLHLTSDVVLLDAGGNSYFWDASEQAGQFRLNALPDLAPEILDALKTEASAPAQIRAGNRIISTRTVEALRQGGLDVSFAVITPRSAVAGSHLVTLTLFVAGLLVLLTGTTLANRRIRQDVRPLLDMNASIQRAASEGCRADLPLDRPDEIGELAGSFDGLISRLDQQERSARAIFDGVADAVVVIREDGTIVSANHAFSRLFGADWETVQDFHIGEFLASEAWSWQKDAIEAYLEADEIGLTGRERILNGWNAETGAFPAEMTLSPIPGQTEPLFTIIARNVSERIEREEEREKLIEQLNLSNEELGEFAYVASHDLKAPLRAIASSAEWLAEDLADKLDDDTRETMEFMRSRVRRMNFLLDDLLTHSRIGRSGEDVTSERVAGHVLADRLALLLSPPDGASIFYSDAFRAATFAPTPLETVLLNLISNALKHTDTAEPVIQVDLQDRGSDYEIRVEDNGPGIPPRYHDQVFGLFKTLKSRDEVEGSGMGLSIVRKHVRLKGGDIRIVSDGKGDGATFIFTWPKPSERTAADAT
ncbi:sensor histidine kinase [Palleronia sp. LCG004]|uniref:sensor histidine kinase n=1 Tax=Palleronia sp. LCG004 TaxID=3079304 RepID=UPI00294254F2|nr:ATP-binding protein [Palleronia sp. LCG004]WOI57923.1 ATP-binding protein [Palleronia sp. LCG004]